MYLRQALRMATGDYISVFDPDAYYGPDYLRDALDAFRYTDATFVGKRAHYVVSKGGEGVTASFPHLEYSEVGWLDEGSITFRREALEASLPGDLSEGALILFQIDCRRAGLKLFATDRFNYVPASAALIARAGERTLAAAVV